MKKYLILSIILIIGFFAFLGIIGEVEGSLSKFILIKLTAMIIMILDIIAFKECKKRGLLPKEF